MQIKAILFDLDGTILDSVPVILASFREVCEDMGLPFDEEFVRSHIGIPLEPQGQMFAGDRGDEFVERYRENYEKYHGLDTHLFPGAGEALHTLRERGFRLALVTSKSLRAVSRIIATAGIAEHFEVVITADHVARHKPHPEPILKAMDALGVAAEETVYVGDARFDVEASAGAGVPMIGVSWGAGLREELAPGCVAVLDSWQQVVEWAGKNQGMCESSLQLGSSGL
jgi:pyrophosphatase PpaX